VLVILCREGNLTMTRKQVRELREIIKSLIPHYYKVTLEGNEHLTCLLTNTIMKVYPLSGSSRFKDSSSNFSELYHSTDTTPERMNPVTTLDTNLPARIEVDSFHDGYIDHFLGVTSRGYDSHTLECELNVLNLVYNLDRFILGRPGFNTPSVPTDRVVRSRPTGLRGLDDSLLSTRYSQTGALMRELLRVIPVKPFDNIYWWYLELRGRGMGLPNIVLQKLPDLNTPTSKSSAYNSMRTRRIPSRECTVKSQIYIIDLLN
jgi:hypothetical protein